MFKILCWRCRTPKPVLLACYASALHHRSQPHVVLTWSAVMIQPALHVTYHHLACDRYMTVGTGCCHPAYGGASCTMATLHPSFWMGVMPSGLKKAEAQTWQSLVLSRQALISSNGILAAKLAKSQRQGPKNPLHLLMFSCKQEGYSVPLHNIPVATSNLPLCLETPLSLLASPSRNDKGRPPRNRIQICFVCTQHACRRVS